MLSLLLRLLFRSHNSVTCEACGISFLGGWETVLFLFFHCYLPFFPQQNNSVIPLSHFSPIIMDDLTKHWNCLSLSKREGDDICFKKDCCSKEHIIAARFLTRRALNMDTVARTFKPLWRTNNGFTISSEGFHRVLQCRSHSI